MIRIIARAAPSWRADDWKAEWDAEIAWYLRQHAQSQPLGVGRQLQLVGRCLGAVPHLLWLSRPQDRFHMPNVHQALRRLRQHPVTTLVAVTSLALGIGANTVIFSAVNTLLWRPLPYGEPDRILRLTATVPENGWDDASLPWPDVADFRARAQTLQNVAGFRPAGVTMLTGDRPERVAGVAAEWSLFHVLGVMPALGRPFSESEDQPGADRVVVLLHDRWQQAFGGDPTVLGRTIALNDVPHVVIGVMAPGFTFPGRPAAEFLLPLRANATTWNRATGGLQALARLSPGVTLPQASAEVAAIARQLADAFPQTNATRGARVISLHDDLYSGDFRLLLFLLWGAVALVLLIAILNVANVQLALAMTRDREMAVRAALGGSAGRVAGLVLTESIVLGLAGAIAAVVVGLYAARALVAIAPPGVDRLDQIRVDGCGVAFTAVLGLIGGVLFGLAPAIHARSTALMGVLREGTRASGGRHRVRLRRVFVITQVAIAVVLLVGAGLLARSMRELLTIDPGFRTIGLWTFQVTLPSRYASSVQVTEFQRRALEELTSLRGVSSAGATLALPLAGGVNNTDFFIEGEAVTPGKGPSTGSSFVTSGYFDALGIDLIRGRGFEAADGPGAPGVAVLSAAAARRYFPETEPLGKRIRMNWDATPDRQPYWRTIVGIVADVRQGGWLDEPRSEIYVPYAQLPWPIRDMTFTVAHDAAAASAVPRAARDAIARVDRSIPLYRERGIEDIVRDQLATTRLLTWLLGTFSALGAALTGLGLFGVISFTVAQRTREVGIRAALGAAPGAIMREVIAQGFVLVIAGALIGIAGALVGSRLLTSVLYNVGGSDPVALGSTIALIAIVGLVGCWLPARRAARVDPLIALRHE